ncbi:MAG: FKBP-type peptidyl-prolyl cis-trans isomerase [Eubacterium sp.]|nr:FKBP-type peptidyl-prolyl cis-trans isomerase [Eubacterium sp.]
MKKKFAIFLLAACMLTACGSKGPTTTGNEPIENAVYTDDSVSLAPYTGLKAEKKNYIVTENAVDDQIHEELMEFAEYQSVDRPAKSGDYVQTDFQASIDGSVVMKETSYDVILGAQEYGEAFDEKLTGVSVDDELHFSLDYDSDFMDVEWAGKTVDFEIRVTGIQEELLPDPTDAFIKENTSYSSYDEFEAAMRTSITDSYEQESTQELQENLLQQVIDNSSILQYTQEDYEAARERVQNTYGGYLEIFGMENLEDVYEFLDMTKEDVEEEVQITLYRTLIVNAIVKNEQLSVSDDEYEDGIRYYMEQTGAESKEELLETYGEEEVRTTLLEDKVLNFLVNHAEITEVEAEHEDE